MKLICDPTSTTNPYLRRGYKNREEYLREQAEAYDVPLRKVKAAADVLGPDEDFDALLSVLEDLTDMEV